MLLPLVLILVAGLSAGAVAYGTSPVWMLYPHGLEVIAWSRRLEWPLVSISLIACILLIALVISGRRRAWWLIGLAPLLALYGHRFALGPAAGQMHVIENPPFVSAEQSNLKNDEWVVGLTFDEKAYAYPYAALFTTPVVIQADHEKRFMVIWSAFANRALAVPVGQDVHARNFDAVSTPANALLLYDARHGQFINGLTAQTLGHEKPAGISNEHLVPTTKMPWSRWRTLHPDTMVLGGVAVNSRSPAEPIVASWPMPPLKLDRPPTTRVAVVGVRQPLAIEAGMLTAAPLNAKADSIPVLLFREQTDSPLRAFDRRLFDRQGKLDLIAEFAPNLNHRKHPAAFMVDVASNTGWSAEGICVDAPADVKYLKGRRLETMALDEELPWGVVKYWYPDVKLEIPPAAPIAVEGEGEAEEPAGRPAHHRPRRPRAAAQ